MSKDGGLHAQDSVESTVSINSCFGNTEHFLSLHVCAQTGFMNYVLCRVFVQEESRQYQREEEERRREVSSKFQATINDISVKMQEHHQRNQALRQENLE